MKLLTDVFAMIKYYHTFGNVIKNMCYVHIFIILCCRVKPALAVTCLLYVMVTFSISLFTTYCNENAAIGRNSQLVWPNPFIDSLSNLRVKS